MKYLRVLRRVLRVHLLTHPVTVVLSALMIVTSLVVPFLRIWPHLARLWARWVLWVSGIQVKVKYEGEWDTSRPFILMSNHVSNMDIPLLFHTIPAEFTFLTKHTLKRVPFFGWALWAAGFVFVDRSHPEAARKSIDLAAEKIRSGQSIVVFPEGTRSPDGELLPFKKGGFVLASKTGVQLVPVFLAGAFEAMPKDTLETRASVVEVRIGNPIDTGLYGLDQKDELMEVVRGAIERLRSL